MVLQLEIVILTVIWQLVKWTLECEIIYLQYPLNVYIVIWNENNRHNFILILQTWRHIFGRYKLDFLLYMFACKKDIRPTNMAFGRWHVSLLDESAGNAGRKVESESYIAVALVAEELLATDGCFVFLRTLIKWGKVMLLCSVWVSHSVLKVNCAIRVKAGRSVRHTDPYCDSGRSPSATPSMLRATVE
jgi:hypothetical protein